MDDHFSSAKYWEARYRNGGTSGAGSQGRLVAYKAAVINSIIALNGISMSRILAAATATCSSC